jgi:hypothetical protein
MIITGAKQPSRGRRLGLDRRGILPLGKETRRKRQK